MRCRIAKSYSFFKFTRTVTSLYLSFVLTICGHPPCEEDQRRNAPQEQLVVVRLQLPQLDLQPGALLGRLVQGDPGVRQLRLVQRLEPGHFSAGLISLLRDLKVQHCVLRLQAPNFVYVDGQTVVQLAQLSFLLQPAYSGGAQRRARGACASSLAGWGCGRHCKLN